MNRRYGLGLEVAYLKADQNTILRHLRFLRPATPNMTLEALEGADPAPFAEGETRPAPGPPRRGDPCSVFMK